jgi:hypothetical protein
LGRWLGYKMRSNSFKSATRPTKDPLSYTYYTTYTSESEIVIIKFPEVLRLGGSNNGVDVLGVSNCSGTTHHNGNNNNNNAQEKKERIGVGVVLHGIPPLPRGGGEQWSSGGGAQPASSSLHLGTNSNTNSTHVTCEGGSPSSESSFGKLSLSNKSYEPSRMNTVNKAFISSSRKSTTSSSSSSKTKEKRRRGNLADVEDLIHLNGPLTEDNILRVIQARINAQRYSVRNKSFF